MSGHWVYKGIVKRFVNGGVEVVGRVSGGGLEYWRLFANGRKQ